MRIWSRKREEIRVGDQILIMDQAIGESQELLAEVIEIRRILGKPTYLVKTGPGGQKLVGDHQVRGMASSKLTEE